MSEDRHTKYRHTSKILQIRFQTTTIKWVLQENELQSFCWWRSSLQFINNATLVKHNKAKSNKTYAIAENWLSWTWVPVHQMSITYVLIQVYVENAFKCQLSILQINIYLHGIILGAQGICCCENVNIL